MATAPSRLVLFLLLGASSAAQAQGSQGLPPLPFGQQSEAAPQSALDSGTVTLKAITQLTVEDVTVTDPKGQPVHGLTQSDFTVKEDGKLQSIKNFQEYSAENPQAQAAPLQLPPNVYSNRYATTTSAVNILLFDDVITGGSPEIVGIERLQAIKVLKTLPPGTQVAILKLTFGLRIVRGFTSDRDVLLAAVDSLKPEPIPGTSVSSTAQSGGGGIPSAEFRGGSPAQSGYGLPPPPPGEDCRAMNNESEMTTAALDAIAAFVSGIKGRKNLIWFTPGIPWLTNYPRFSRIPCLRDYSLQLHRAYGLLTAAQVAVYPVDPRGPGPMGENTFSIRDIAKATGGVAYYGRNDLDGAVSEAIANGANYYSLSYVPPLSKYDGKFHTIEVKVDRPGVHLHYREGYTGLDAAQPLKVDKKNAAKAAAPPISEFHSAMMYGKPDATELLFDVSVLPSPAPAVPGGTSGPPVVEELNPKLNGKPLVQYDFNYELPAGEITLAGDDPSGAHKGSVEIVVAAFNADGELLSSTQRTANFPVKADQVEQFMQQPSRFNIQLDLPPGKLFVRVGILDVPSQKMGVLEVPETVASKQ